MKTPVNPRIRVPELGYPGALEPVTRRFLWITIATGATVGLTHQSLTAALASAHRDSALKVAHAMLTWPLPMTQPILAGVATFVLLGFAVQTNGWRRVTAQQSRLLLGFTVAVILGAGPMVLFCAVTIAILVIVLTLGLTLLLVLFLLLLLLAQ